MSDNLPAVPWADLMDEAEATYWDAENVHGTDAGIRALAEWAYRKGLAAPYQGGETEWRSGTRAMTWLTEPEEIARNRARTWAESGGFLEMRHVGPWTRVEVRDE